MTDFTHVDDKGQVRIVDISDKQVTKRVAKASAKINMDAETLRRIIAAEIEKGEVLAIARIAGIMAAKQTHGLIPLCHPVQIDSVSVEFTPVGDRQLLTEALVTATDRTGVEMEALTAVSVAALTVYDMCKSIDRSMAIDQVQLDQKTGGKSGDYRRK